MTTNPTSTSATSIPAGIYTKAKPTAEDKFISIGECPTTKREIVLCYQTHGNPQHPTLLLVNGLGGTLFQWRDEFVSNLVKKGFFVVRYDCRDCGCSTHLDGLPTPLLPRLVLPLWASPGEGKPPYALEDMARDGWLLMEKLGLVDSDPNKQCKKVHLFGGSMGGMIVQLMAVSAPERTASLNILYSNTGGAEQKPQTWGMTLSFLDKPASREEKDIMDFKVRMAERFAGSYPVDPKEVTDRARMLTQRCPDDIAAIQRQMWAIQRCSSRVERLRALNPDPTADLASAIAAATTTTTTTNARRVVPTTIIHGLEDTMIPHENGVQLLNTIHYSKLVSFPKMGHSMPQPLMEPIAAEVALHLRSK